MFLSEQVFRYGRNPPPAARERNGGGDKETGSVNAGELLLQYKINRHHMNTESDCESLASHSFRTCPAVRAHSGLALTSQTLS